MPTSELSDALNPYYAQPRSRPNGQRPAQHDVAVSPPSPPISSRSHGGGVHAVQELLRFLASTREAQEIERKRRIAWEQDQEAKYRLGQAEMERRMFEMQQEITALKARVACSTNARSQQPTPSTSPTLSHPPTPATGQVPSSSSASCFPSLLLPASRVVNADGSAEAHPQLDYSDSEAETDPDVSVQYRIRRKNHHDRRCLTIQHAMRNHLLRVMMLESDKELPDGHVEGTPLGSDEPVRFVWDKTPRQSVHNGRMKERVLKDLKASRKLYKHVPDKEFGKKTLDSAFDQAFVTLRQKFRAQRDDAAARAHKQREEVKAQRARRLSRRKVKLGNRIEARNRMAVFEQAVFDGAFQIECMSEEESEMEEDETDGTRTTVLRIRGLAWRSARLERFFGALDEEDRVENAQRPRRGVGRKERVPGPPKTNAAPPKGVARWMVSKRYDPSPAGTVPEDVSVLGEESE